MKPVLIIAAVPQEICLLESTLSNTSKTKITGLQCTEGSIGTIKTVVCAGGIGKINAAMSTTLLIEKYRPRLVINTGCAGAYPGSGLSIGDLVVASNEILGDEGVLTSKGWKDLLFMKLPSFARGRQVYYNEIPLSKHPAEKAMQLADFFGVFLMRGHFVTVSTCRGTLRRGKALARRFNGIAENMEGAAVAQVCLRYGVDCLEIRGISNHVAERNMRTWDIPRAVEAAQRFVLKYLENEQRAVMKESVPIAEL